MACFFLREGAVGKGFGFLDLGPESEEEAKWLAGRSFLREGWMAELEGGERSASRLRLGAIVRGVLYWCGRRSGGARSCV